jgi:hypothetical protein
VEKLTKLDMVEWRLDRLNGIDRFHHEFGQLFHFRRIAHNGLVKRDRRDTAATRQREKTTQAIFLSRLT